jgi:hypothetical protein
MSPLFQLSEQQQQQIRTILTTGCDRQTAVDYVGCTLEELRQAMQLDAAFAGIVRRAEAAAEVRHMQNVEESAKQEKNWRASVWWLERRSPERFGARGPGAMTARQLKEFNAVLTAMLVEEVQNVADRRRIVERLSQVVAQLEQGLRDSQSQWLNLLLADEGPATDDIGAADHNREDAEAVWKEN